MWDFVDIHSQFYAEMVKEWNKKNPDKQINITFTTYPYQDMHNKLKMAIQAGTGAPDMCDIEISQFPTFLGQEEDDVRRRLGLGAAGRAGQEAGRGELEEAASGH